MTGTRRSRVRGGGPTLTAGPSPWLGSGLDGVRAAGKSWYLRDFYSVSIPPDRKADAVRIANENGLKDYVAVNTASLKSWLIEQHKERGGETLAAGTPWEGIVSEYHETRLSRQTLPKE